jgi:peptidase M23-like protein
MRSVRGRVGSVMALAALPLGLLAVLFLGTPAIGSPLIDPGPFAPDRVTLGDGRVIEIPAETHAVYRMLTQTGRIHGRHTTRPSEAEARAGIELRHQHEARWAMLFGNRPRTPESEYVLPVEHGYLSARSGYKPGHRAEDVFASPGHRVFAPAAMLIVHAGYLSKTAGEAVVGLVPGDRDHHARYFAFVHIDTTPAKAHVGEVVEAGTLIGYVAKTDEAIVGNSLGRLPHVHFLIAEERPDGRLDGIPVWRLLRRLNVKAQHEQHRHHAS